MRRGEARGERTVLGEGVVGSVDQIGLDGILDGQRLRQTKQGLHMVPVGIRGRVVHQVVQLGPAGATGDILLGGAPSEGQQGQ